MKKPNALAELIQELQAENAGSDVEVIKTSKASIFVDDPKDGIELSALECALLFASPAAVKRLAEVLDNKAATLILFDVGVSDDVAEALERNFATVDEG